MGAAAGGALEDQRFSASSSYDEASVGPEEARYVFGMLLDHLQACRKLSKYVRDTGVLEPEVTGVPLAPSPLQLLADQLTLF